MQGEGIQTGSSVGQVGELNGEATITRHNGQQQNAKEGDILYAGDVIHTAEQSAILLNLDQGVVTLAASETLILSETLLAQLPSLVRENEFNTDHEQSTDLERVKEAIAKGEDITKVLEATSAGDPRAGSNVEVEGETGDTIVFWVRSGSSVTPVSGFSGLIAPSADSQVDFFGNTIGNVESKSYQGFSQETEETLVQPLDSEPADPSVVETEPNDAEPTQIRLIALDINGDPVFAEDGISFRLINEVAEGDITQYMVLAFEPGATAFTSETRLPDAEQLGRVNLTVTLSDGSQQELLSQPLGTVLSFSTEDDYLENSDKNFTIAISQNSYAPTTGGYEKVSLDTTAVTTTVKDDSGTWYTPDDGVEADHEVVSIKLIALDDSGDPLFADDGVTYLQANNVVEGSSGQYMVLAFDPGATTFTSATRLPDAHQVGSVNLRTTLSDGSSQTVSAQDLGTPFTIGAEDNYLADNGRTFSVAISENSYARTSDSYENVQLDTTAVTTTVNDDSGTPAVPDDGVETDHEVVQIKLIALDTNGNPLFADDGMTYLQANDVAEGSAAQYMVLAFAPDANTFTSATRLADADQVGSVNLTVAFSDGSNQTLLARPLGTAFTIGTEDNYLADSDEVFTVVISENSYAPTTGSYENVSIDTAAVTTTVKDDSGTPFILDDGVEADHEVVQIKLIALDVDGNPLFADDGVTYLSVNEVVEGTAAQYMALAFAPDATTFTSATRLPDVDQVGSVTLTLSNGSAKGAESQTTENGNQDFSNSIVNATLGQAVSVNTFDDYRSDQDETFTVAISGNSYTPATGGYENVSIDTTVVTTVIKDDSGTPQTPDDGVEIDHEVVQIKLIALDADGNPLFANDGVTYLLANEAAEGSAAQYMVLAFAPGATTFTSATRLPDAEQVGTVNLRLTTGSAIGAGSQSTDDGSEDFNNTSVTATLGQVVNVAAYRDNAIAEARETFSTSIVESSYNSISGGYENFDLDTTTVTTTVGNVAIFAENRDQYTIDVQSTRVLVTHIESRVQTSIPLDTEVYEFADRTVNTNDPQFDWDVVANTDNRVDLGTGNDTVALSEGPGQLHVGGQSIYAGEGTDTVVFSGNRADYTIGYQSAHKRYVVRHVQSNETNVLYDVELVRFLADSPSDPIVLATAVDDVVSGTDLGTIYLESGDDTVTLSEGSGHLGSQSIRGGEGTDTAIFAGNRSDYTIGYQSAHGRYAVRNVHSNEVNYLYDVEQVRFLSDSPNDPITLSTAINDHVSGTDYRTIYLESGDDTMTLNEGAGHTGTQTVYGGEGNDTAIFSGSRSDYTIDYQVAHNRYVVRNIHSGESNVLYDIEQIQFLSDVPNDPITLTVALTNDEVSGTDLGTIYLGSGDDTMTLSEGAGHLGTQNVRGGEGNDTAIFAGNRSDYTIDYQVAHNRYVVRNIHSGESNVLYDIEQVQFLSDIPNDPVALTVALVNDEVSGTDLGSISLGSGDDTVTLSEGAGHLGSQSIRGGEGTDTAIFAGNRSDYTIGYQSAHGRYAVRNVHSNEVNYLYDVEQVQFLSDSPNDPITLSTAINDHVSGTDYRTIYLESGDDTMTLSEGAGHTGAQTVYGGEGNDTAIFAGSRSDYIIDYQSAHKRYLIRHIHSNEVNYLYDVEQVQFLADVPNDPVTLTIALANDEVSGTDLGTLYLGGGDDTLTLSEGAKHLGSQTIHGGDGSDTVIFSGNRSDYVVDLQSGGRYIVRNIHSGETNTIYDTVETARFADGDVAVNTNFANDVASGADRDVSLGSGNDTLTLSEGVGHTGSQVVRGGSGSDTLVFSGNRADYQSGYESANGRYFVQHLSTGEVNYLYSDVEQVRFADMTVATSDLSAGGLTAPTSMAQTVFGTSGDDTAVLTGNRTDYTIDYEANNKRYAIHNVHTNELNYVYDAVEQIQFADQTVAVNADLSNDTISDSNLNVILGSGDDELTLNETPGSGSQFIRGGSGNDTVIFSGNRADYMIDYQDVFSRYQVRNIYTNEVDYIANDVETLRFADGDHALSDTNLADDVVGKVDNRSLSLGTGDDTVTLSEGVGHTDHQNIRGGAGDDTVILSGNRADYTIDYESANSRYVIRSIQTGETNYIYDDVETLRFADGDNVLNSDILDDEARATDNSVVYLGAGDDTVTLSEGLGHLGTQYIHGGAGDDMLILSGDRADYVVDYQDTHGRYLIRNIHSNEANYIYNDVETLRFNDGDLNVNNNLIHDNVGKVDNNLSLGAGNDTVTLSEGLGRALSQQEIRGGSGDDTVILSGNRAAYTIDYEAGNTRYVVRNIQTGERNYIRNDVETLRFADGDLALNNDILDDVVSGTDYTNINLGAGDDRVTLSEGLGHTGNQNIRGGSGDDMVILAGDRSEYIVDYQDSQGRYLLRNIYTNEANYIYNDVETLRFADGDLTLNNDLLHDTVGKVDNNLSLGAGDDTATLSEGLGHTGTQFVRGGSGNDTVIFSGNRADYVIDYQESSSRYVIRHIGTNETNYIYDDVETLRFADGDRIVNRGLADDVFSGTDRNVSLGSGDDTLTLSEGLGHSAGQHIRGGSGDDTVVFSGKRSEYTIGHESSGRYFVKHINTGETNYIYDDVENYTFAGADPISTSLAGFSDDNIFLEVGNKVDGGEGYDSVFLETDEGIDFSALANDRIKNIEEFDLSVYGDHHLEKLSLADVLSLTDDDNTLAILGGSGDQVNFNAGDGWVKNDLGNVYSGNPIAEGGHIFDVYTNTGDPTVEVRVESAIQDSIF